MAGARANPFCGPADTTFRFVLLAVAAVAAAAFAWDSLWISVNGQRYVSTLVACEQRVGGAGGFDATFGGVTDRNRAVQRCLGHLNREQALWSALGAVGVIVLALVVVALLPPWKVRRRQLRPVADKLPSVTTRVHALAADEGITRTPEVLWNRRSTGGDAVAFGVPGHYRIALGPALVARAYTDAPAFDAVVRHELAHIANRDIVLAYLANAIWYAWCAVALVPLVIGFIGYDHSLLWPIGWRTAVMAGLIYLTRNGLLRAREHYADVRASRRDGPDGATAQILAGAAPRAVDRRPTVLRWHPSPAERLAIVRDPTPLLRLGLLDAFAAGLVGGIAIPTVSNFIVHLASGSRAITSGPAMGTGVVAALLGAVLATAVWRSRVAVRTSGGGGAPPALAALVLAAGVLLAQPLSLTSSADVRLFPTTIAELGALAATLVVVAAVYLWAVDVADPSLDRVNPRRALMAVVVGATALALAWAVTLGVTLTNYTTGLALFSGLASLFGLGADSWHSLAQLLEYRADTSRLDWLVWVGVVGVPLVGLVMAHRRAATSTTDTPPSWAYLELPPPGTTWRRLDGVRVTPALAAGLVGGVAGVVVAIAGRLVQRGLVDDGTENWRKIRVVQGSWWIAAGTVLLTAAVVAARSRRIPMALGMLAALVTALVSSAGILIGWRLLGDRIGGRQIEDLSRTVVGLALFTGLAGAMTGIGVRTVARAVRPTAMARPGPIGWAAAGVAAVVLAATVGTGAALAGGTAPVNADFRDFALTDGLFIVTEVGRLEQQIQALPPDATTQVQAVRTSLVPKLRSLHDRAVAAVTLTRPVGELRDRFASDLAATADGLEDYAAALERADTVALQRAVTTVQGALSRLDGSGNELLRRAVESGITS